MSYPENRTGAPESGIYNPPGTRGTRVPGYPGTPGTQPGVSERWPGTRVHVYPGTGIRVPRVPGNSYFPGHPVGVFIPIPGVLAIDPHRGDTGYPDRDSESSLAVHVEYRSYTPLDL
eukprot:880528-Rhodomonas_salina.1